MSQVATQKMYYISFKNTTKISESSNILGINKIWSQLGTNKKLISYNPNILLMAVKDSHSGNVVHTT